MAAALLQKILCERGIDPQGYRIVTAGLLTQAGWLASPGAIRAMHSEGLDISGHRSQVLDQKLIKAADVVLTMTADHRRCIIEQYGHQGDKIYTLAELAGEGAQDVFDPFGMDEVKYIESAAEIKRLLYKIVDRMAKGQ